MRKKSSAIIISIVFLIVFIAALLSYLFLGKVKQNPPGTAGNTAGNLNNGGTFCELDGRVYFANAYDQNTLYSMNADETEIKKLSGAVPTYLNAAGKNIYYYQQNSSGGQGLGSVIRTNGLFRTDLKGKSSVCLKKALSGVMALADNFIYYQFYDPKDGMSLYRIATDESGDIPVSPMPINPAGVANGKIYFNGTTQDHYLYSLNLADNSITTVWEYDLWNPALQGDYIYYMDIHNNYRLCRYSLSTGESMVLSEDRVDAFNVYGDIIYYQKNSETEPALKRINTDGSGEEVVMDGVFEHIQITSRYVYFNQFDTPIPVYRTPVTGPVSVAAFEGAKNAAYEEAAK